MKRLDLLAAAVLAVGGIGLATSPSFGQAAADQPAAQQPAAGQPTAAQPSAAQPSDSSAQSAKDRTGSSSSSAQASESDIRQALSQTAQAVLTQGGASNLSQQFCQRDQDRLKDLSSSASQIDQSVQQLRQAYKDKFQKDLDLTAGADQIFTSEFFHAGAAGESARQASAQIGADQSSSGAAAGASASGSASGANPSAGVSGTAGQSGTASGQSGGAAASGQASGTGASGSANIGGASVSGSAGTSPGGAAAGATGDQAQTASSSAGGMQMTSVTIPASHDMPEARINLVKEGGSWKIDLPDSVDAQKLSQNLQQQLSQATTMKDKWGSDANEAARAISHSVFIALGGDTSGATGASGASGTSGGTSTGGAGTSGGTSSTPGTGTNR